jgi:hypothetical protein
MTPSNVAYLSAYEAAKFLIRAQAQTKPVSPLAEELAHSEIAYAKTIDPEAARAGVEDAHVELVGG